jgi:hypothetical protein
MQWVETADLLTLDLAPADKPIAAVVAAEEEAS